MTLPGSHDPLSLGSKLLIDLLSLVDRAGVVKEADIHGDLGLFAHAEVHDLGLPLSLCPVPPIGNVLLEATRY